MSDVFGIVAEIAMYRIFEIGSCQKQEQYLYRMMVTLRSL